ncbi:IucA/IucC family protein [Shewanella sp. OMA3-2]|uniref:IucA/IucC family protein n=1 Tax=Shewanella sp. OMA3-2 TaxID=2908650 RepID=UPI001F2EE7CB|nr:IucA/IucC family protein [Shewanella sp. OMA3-2]UJF22080.1 hypothetical protein L0B17_01035 [Shewanella sp. OMA3-2]
MLIQSKNEVKQGGNKYSQQVYQQQAEANAIGCLLNCYLREFAIVRNEVDLNDTHPDCPLSLSQSLPRNRQKVRIRLPESNAVLLVVADRVSLLGRIRFSSQLYLKKTGSFWQLSSVSHLTELLLNHLAKITNSAFNHELLDQIGNSIDVTNAFLQRVETCGRVNTNMAMSIGAQGLIASEQSLLWGHAMHPTPKSRHGVAFDDMLACSPEIQANFSLYWFKVDPSIVKQLHCSDMKPMDWIGLIKPDRACLYPCHPWEVNTILAQPLVQKAITAGLIEPLGQMGSQVYPTSSVRTTYLPDINQFMKFSIHVRLTNCVRKNAWYELDSAVALSRVLMAVADEAYLHCPNFALMAEPGASTLDLSGLFNDDQDTPANKAQHLMVSECFGILYREGIPDHQLERYKPLMAGALFAWDNRGQSVCEMQIMALAKRTQQEYEQTVIQWFSAYIDVLLPGIFYFFFKRGVAFEPHLQNTVIGFENGLPAFIWLRDLEGTKLVPEFWPSSSLQGLSGEAKRSVYYSREQGWSRVAYCGLINNVSEAMFHLAAGDQVLEAKLWQILANVIHQWQQIEGLQPELVGLLQGDRIPSKNNLSTRLFMKADKLSSYTQLASPLGHCNNRPEAMRLNRSAVNINTSGKTPSQTPTGAYCG